MKATIYLIVLISLISCATGRHALNTRHAQKLYIKKIELRNGKGHECYSDSVIVHAGTYEFTVISKSMNLHIIQVHIIHTDPNLYSGVSTDGIVYMIYYYAYRDRVYIQLTPVPKGFTDDPILPEYIYILSTERYC